VFSTILSNGGAVVVLCRRI